MRMMLFLLLCYHVDDCIITTIYYIGMSWGLQKYSTISSSGINFRRRGYAAVHVAILTLYFHDNKRQLDRQGAQRHESPEVRRVDGGAAA